MARRSFILIVGHGPELEREEGAAQTLRALGAHVRTIEMWEDPRNVLDDDAGFGAKNAEGDPKPQMFKPDVRVILVETPERPDLSPGLLRAVRKDQRLEGVPAIAAVSVAHVSRLDPSGGFDDFVLVPYVPAELYARIRKVEWQRSEFATEERVKIGKLVIDRSAHEACIDGQTVSLTAKEFSLLSYLCERRGKVVSRDELLRRVWGNRYEGGPRTVDIHVTRLRTKFGAALPLVTLRGAGYRLDSPGSVGEGEELDDSEEDQRALVQRRRSSERLSV